MKLHTVVAKHGVACGVLVMLLAAFGIAPHENAEDDRIVTVIEEAESYLGVRYRLGGSSRSSIDCSALMQNSFSAAGIWIPRTSWLQADHPGQTISSISDLRPGDLVFFPSRGLTIGHVGLVTEIRNGRVRFIHASSNNGEVAYDFLTGRWVDSFVKGKRFFKSSGTPPSVSPPAVPSSSRSFPLASQRRLTASDIQGLSQHERDVIRNELYAIHGYELHINRAMMNHFNNLDWYRAIPNKTRNAERVWSRMSQVERDNVIFLKNQ